MEPLAKAEDIAKLGVDVSNTDRVNFLLDSVSSSVREAAGTPITIAEATIIREGTWDQNLLLPGAPIRAISEVLLDGKPLTDWRLRQNRLWRSQGWTDSRSEVEITYTYGLDKPPADIVKLVATFVAAGLNEAEDGVGSRRGLSSVRIDDASESYTRGDDEIVDLTELPQRVKDSLAERFSGSAFVSRSL